MTILRYFEGRREDDAVGLAGCSVDALHRRATDGLAKLRKRLSKGGIALGGVALAGLLTSEASAAVPETLLPSILATVKTAAATTATATTATSTAAMLAKGAMKAMFIAKVKMVAAVVAAVVVTGSGAIVAQEVAAALAEYRPRVDPELLTAYRLDMAQSLTDKSHGSLRLPGLTNLTPEVAEELAKCAAWNGELPGLKALSVDTAKALANFKGQNLRLNSITTLSDDVATALSTAIRIMAASQARRTAGPPSLPKKTCGFPAGRVRGLADRGHNANGCALELQGQGRASARTDTTAATPEALTQGHQRPHAGVREWECPYGSETAALTW